MRARQMVLPGRKGLISLLATCIGLAGMASALAEDPPEAGLRVSTDLWQAGVGSGFRKGASEVGLGLGAGAGLTILGTQRHHHWALGVVQYGRMLSDPVGDGTWHRGNWQLLAEVFGGMQFHPSDAYLWGVAPLVRYNFTPGGRWVPFVDLGAGLSGTDIRDGDVSSTFEFNLQIGAGTHYFLRDDLAVTAQLRYFHLSDAGISSPNLGVNNFTLLLGVNLFF